MTVTDEKLRHLIQESLKGRQNAHRRALRRDCQAALDGDEFCRRAVEERLSR